MPSPRHGLVMLAAVRENEHSYSLSRLIRCFRKRPRLMCIHVVAMLLLGLFLVVTGGRSEKQ